MFCWRCGNEVVDEAYICPNCGCLVGGRDAVEEVKYKNGIAVAGFICSFFIPLLGWIFGGIGLSRAKKRNGKGGRTFCCGDHYCKYYVYHQFK